MRRMAGTRGTLAGLLLVIGGLTTVGCGGSDDKDDVASGGFGGVVNPPEPEESPGAEPESEGGGSVDSGSVTIGESVHFSGFVFELGQAELGPSEGADGSDVGLAPSEDLGGDPAPALGRLTIDAVIENLGEDDVAPDQSELHLEQGGQALNLDPLSYEGLPVVPGGSTTNAEIVFDDLPEDFSLDDAELVFGDGTVNQARVPLGGEGELVTLAPIELTPGAPGQAGEVGVAVTGGQMIYGDPAFHISIPEGSAYLVVEFELTTTPALDQPGGVHFGGGHVRLVLPDGTSVADAGDGVSSPSVVIEGGATFPGLVARYEIPADLRGTFQLAVSGPFGPCCDPAEGAATFELTG